MYERERGSERMREKGYVLSLECTSHYHTGWTAVSGFFLYKYLLIAIWTHPKKLHVCMLLHHLFSTLQVKI